MWDDLKRFCKIDVSVHLNQHLYAMLGYNNLQLHANGHRYRGSHVAEDPISGNPQIYTHTHTPRVIWELQSVYKACLRSVGGT